MSMDVTVNPYLLRWARERAFLSPDSLAGRVHVRPERVTEWERTGRLKLAHLERVASKTHTPLGYLFLPEPPDVTLPIPDFRTVDGDRVQRPSPDLLDTIYQCQRRQDWFRGFLISDGEAPLAFVGSAHVVQSPIDVARSIRDTIGLEISDRSALTTWEEALRNMATKVEDAGILVMRNGVVGNNTHRKLNVGEFRGFVLIDDYAPLVFVNGADAKAAQMFTLAHEIAHVWLGQSGLDNASVASQDATERFCNQVAAELLIPMSDFRVQWNASAEMLAEAQRLARHYKLSTLVILIRAYEAGYLSEDHFRRFYAEERGRGFGKAASAGGDFYSTQRSRLGRRFARAVIASSLEGHTLVRDALSLLGLKKIETFHKLAREMGVMAA